VTVEVCHTFGDAGCLELASLTAMALRCEVREDPPGIDGRIVRVSVHGHVVASVELGPAPRTDEWVTRMAASLARSVLAAGADFGGQGDVSALHKAHGLDRYDAAKIWRARSATRARDRRRVAEAAGLPTATNGTTATDDGGE
jgi:hypothetical protein